MDRHQIDQLRARASHCRDLAERATDPEVGAALREVADEIDAAIPILEESLTNQLDQQ